jgi:hypothetical protein
MATVKIKNIEIMFNKQGFIFKSRIQDHILIKKNITAKLLSAAGPRNLKPINIRNIGISDVLRFFTITVMFIFFLETAVFKTVEARAAAVSYEAADSIISGDTGKSASNSEGSKDVAIDSGKTSSVTPLPDIYRVSVMMLNQGKKDVIKELETMISTLLSEGKEYEAASVLGTYFGKAHKNSVQYLGSYCREALPLIKGGLQKEVSFLTGFVNGYGKSGVLVISNDGVEKLRVFGRRLGSQWKTVPDGEFPKNKLERIYNGRKAVFIPFSIGEIFKVDISGASKGVVRIWKILPDGSNIKSWQGGPWEREITVRGDRLY